MNVVVRLATSSIVAIVLVGCQTGTELDQCVDVGPVLIAEIRDHTYPDVTLEHFQAVELSEQWGDAMRWLVAARPLMSSDETPRFAAMWEEFEYQAVPFWVVDSLDDWSMIRAADANSAIATDFPSVQTQVALDVSDSGAGHLVYRCVQEQTKSS
jgi:hypothetical protein